jgi:hypothetical protein
MSKVTFDSILGDIPNGINTTKTLTYSGDAITGVTYL